MQKMRLPLCETHRTYKLIKSKHTNYYRYIYMSKVILLMGPLFDATMQQLEADYTVHRYWESSDENSLLASIAKDCVGVVTDGGKGVSNDILQKLPNAKVISVFGVGVDAIDLEFCQAQGIQVGNTPDVLSDDVADLAVALALASCRQLVTGDQYARRGDWVSKGAMPLTTRMMGKKAGIFGMGSIGECLAKRLSGFDMSLSYCNRSEKTNSPYDFVDNLEALAAQSEFLFITAAATSSSVGAVNAKVLDALGSTGYLINVSRGTLIDEPVLVDYLSNGKIAGAGLDVFENEPTIPDALLTLDNVVLQPHNASGTWETRKAMGDLMLENLACHFNNKRMTTPVV